MMCVHEKLRLFREIKGMSFYVQHSNKKFNLMKFVQVLGQAMNLIRIPCMELAEFANGAAQSGILTLQETTDLFLHFTARNKPSVSYPIKPRQGLKKQICHRLVGRLCSLCIGYGCCLGGLSRRVFPWTL